MENVEAAVFGGTAKRAFAMIITREEIQQVHRLVEKVGSFYVAPDGEGVPPGDVNFLFNNPHLLMVLGFDEFKALDFSNVEEELITLKDGSKAYKHEQQIKELYGLHDFDAAFFVESLYRHMNSGAWYWYEGMDPESLSLHGPPINPLREISVNTWLDSLEKSLEEPNRKYRTLWLPSTWTPKVQQEQNILLGESIGDILNAICREEKGLHTIHWRQLEEIIAELLRSRGLDVFVTPRSNDGGRDIIARGELIPGEPTLLAVEVKQKPVVGLADVQRALRANEDIPALLLATAGRFSAGVIKEKQRERNRMRLYLKDGVALSQWIHSYKCQMNRGG